MNNTTETVKLEAISQTQGRYTSPNKTETSSDFGDINGTDLFVDISCIYIRCESREQGDCKATLNGETLNISSTPLKIDITKDSTLDIQIRYTD